MHRALRCKKTKYSLCIQLFIGMLHMSLHAKLTKLWRKKKFDTSPHSDPEWIFGCLIKCNRKCTTLPVLPSSLSTTVIRANVFELQIKAVCYDKEENFILCDIMRSRSQLVIQIDSKNKPCTR